MKVYVHIRANGDAAALYTMKYNVPSMETKFVELFNYLGEALDKLNDGNKIYKVLKLQVNPMAKAGLSLNRCISHYVKEKGDIYCDIQLTVDLLKHVKPAEIKPAPESASVTIPAPEPKVEAPKPQPEEKKETAKPTAPEASGPPLNPNPLPGVAFTTITGYSYYESGKKNVKVLVNVNGVHKHDMKKMNVIFQPRVLNVEIYDMNGKNFQFKVPRLQCKIKPDQCSWSLKEDQVSITLRKEKEEDNWWSLFKSKSVCEADSD